MARSTRPADRLLRPLLQDCRHLLSERGEANGPGIAAGIVRQIDALGDDARTGFFDHLARDFSPDPQQVLAAALAYAKAPTNNAHLIALTQTAEPPRQELFRRLNRTPGGTAGAGAAAPRPAGAAAHAPGPAGRGARHAAPAGQLVQPRLPADAQGRLEFTGTAAGTDHPPRGGARGRRLGRPAPPPAARPPLLCLLPPATARRAADLCRGGACCPRWPAPSRR